MKTNSFIKRLHYCKQKCKLYVLCNTFYLWRTNFLGFHGST